MLKMNTKVEQGKFSIRSILLICALVMIIANSVFYTDRKNGYFLDETATFLLANYKIITFGQLVEVIRDNKLLEFVEEKRAEIYPEDTWSDLSANLSRYVASENGMGSYLSTYLLQARDVHPPLYYDMIHTVSYAFKWMDLKWVGFTVNILFLICACILIYRILNYITGNYFVSIAGVLYYGLSFEFVNAVTYYRMYAMLAFWAVLLLYITLKWHESNYEMTGKMLISISLIEFCAMFTQYFAIFYIFPIFLSNVFLMVKNKHRVGRYIKYSVITGILYLIIWPFSIIHLFLAPDGISFTNNLKNLTIIWKLLASRYWIKNSVFAGSSYWVKAVFVLLFLVAIAAIVRKIRSGGMLRWISSKQFEVYLYLLFPACFHYLVVALFAPYIVDRYQMQVMPILCMIIVFILYKACTLVDKKCLISGVLLMILPFVLLFHWQSRITPYYLYNDDLRNSFISEYVGQEAAIIEPPVDVYASEIDMNFHHPMIYKTRIDGGTEKIAKEMEDHNSLVLYVNKECDTKAIVDQLSELGVSCEELEYSTQFYQIYYLNK